MELLSSYCRSKKFKVVTNLHGSTHSHFFSEALAAAGGAPAHVSVDGAVAWDGVALQMGAIHGNPDKVTSQQIDGEVNSNM
jgi:hypothetical protein